MKNVLIIENSKLLSSLFKQQMEKVSGLKAVITASFEETKKAVSKYDFFVAVASLNIQGAPMGEVVDFTIQKQIPTIVFTGSYSEDMQQQLWSKDIIDYVTKDNPENINYVIALIARLLNNKNNKVIVADDSKISRMLATKLLTAHMYNVLEAENGKEAYEILNANPDTKLIITDYNMPELDGFNLVQKVRKKFSKNRLAIIGMSADGKNNISAKFLKCGANDYISKPYYNEEFYCRVLQNIQTIEYIQKIKDISEHDHLTGLYNRRFYFQTLPPAIDSKKDKNYAIAMIDIDFFKQVNDTYGHDAGDEVLKEIAVVMRKVFGSHVFSRLGGEEFSVYFNNTKKCSPLKLLEEFRKKVEEKTFVFNHKKFSVTVSSGLCCETGGNMQTILSNADQALYKAKESGRNRVIIYQP